MLLLLLATRVKLKDTQLANWLIGNRRAKADKSAAALSDLSNQIYLIKLNWTGWQRAMVLLKEPQQVELMLDLQLELKQSKQEQQSQICINGLLASWLAERLKSRPSSLLASNLILRVANKRAFPFTLPSCAIEAQASCRLV